MLKKACVLAAAVVCGSLFIPSPATTAVDTSTTAASESGELIAISRLTPPAADELLTKDQALKLDAEAKATPALGSAAKLRDVGSGYYLVGNNKTDNYHYTSGRRYNQLLSCQRGICRDRSSVKVWFRQAVQGGSSRRWVYTFFQRRHTGKDAYVSRYSVECAVNIKGDPDEHCSHWRNDGATGHIGPNRFAYGDTQSVYFGRTNRVKKYPMVKLTTDWVGYDASHGKFRGWDTCTSSSNNRLCAATGTGR